MKSIAIAITGASGALYATRTLAALLAEGLHVELVISDYGRRLLRDELGEAASVDHLMAFLADKYGQNVSRGSVAVHNNRDLGATIASGSHGCRGMAIVPCSMKTLAGVAHGLSRNLIERAADVMLKERRPLVIVPRETPMSLPQLKNMVLCAEAGAIILPAMPAFYQLPKTLDDLSDFMAGKIFSALGFEHALYPPWTGRGERFLSYRGAVPLGLPHTLSRAPRRRAPFPLSLKAPARPRRSASGAEAGAWLARALIRGANHDPGVDKGAIDDSVGEMELLRATRLEHVLDDILVLLHDGPSIIRVGGGVNQIAKRRSAVPVGNREGPDCRAAEAAPDGVAIDRQIVQLVRPRVVVKSTRPRVDGVRPSVAEH